MTEMKFYLLTVSSVPKKLTSKVDMYGLWCVSLMKYLPFFSELIFIPIIFVLDRVVSENLSADVCELLIPKRGVGSVLTGTTNIISLELFDLEDEEGDEDDNEDNYIE